jgi:hypothetical protein
VRVPEVVPVRDAAIEVDGVPYTVLGPTPSEGSPYLRPVPGWLCDVLDELKEHIEPRGREGACGRHTPLSALTRAVVPARIAW